MTELAESNEWAEHVEEILPVQSVYELGADSVDIFLKDAAPAPTGGVPQ